MAIYKNILCMTDFSDHAERAVEIAIELAGVFDAKLSLLHVCHDESHFSLFISDSDYGSIRKRIDEEAEKEFEKLEEKFPALPRLNYRRVLRRGSPYIEGLEEIDTGGYDLVVLGSHGRSNFESILYGTTAEKIVRNTSVSVHITRAPRKPKKEKVKKEKAESKKDKADKKKK